MFLRAKEIFTREERLEWASYQLRRDLSSFDELTDDEVLRLLDAIEGWHLISTLLYLRPPNVGAPTAGGGSGREGKRDYTPA